MIAAALPHSVRPVVPDIELRVGRVHESCWDGGGVGVPQVHRSQAALEPSSLGKTNRKHKRRLPSLIRCPREQWWWWDRRCRWFALVQLALTVTAYRPGTLPAIGCPLRTQERKNVQPEPSCRGARRSAPDGADRQGQDPLIEDERSGPRVEDRARQEPWADALP